MNQRNGGGCFSLRGWKLGAGRDRMDLRRFLIHAVYCLTCPFFIHAVLFFYTRNVLFDLSIIFIHAVYCLTCLFFIHTVYCLTCRFLYMQCIALPVAFAVHCLTCCHNHLRTWILCLGCPVHECSLQCHGRCLL